MANSIDLLVRKQLAKYASPNQISSCSSSTILTRSTMEPLPPSCSSPRLSRYYLGWLVCEDPGCSGRTRCLPLQVQQATADNITDISDVSDIDLASPDLPPAQFQRAYPVCPTCSKASMYSEHSATQLYTQLQVQITGI